VWAEFRAHLPHLLPASLALFGVVQHLHQKRARRRT
jgi:hypothetical protein